MVELQSLTLQDFQACTGQAFDVILADGKVYALQLDEVASMGAAPDDANRQPFALRLSNSRLDAYLPQGTYNLRHEKLGVLALFVVPLGPDARGMQYEVIFG